MKADLPQGAATQVRVARYRSDRGGFGYKLARPFFNAWQYQELIRVIVWRELSQRFRDSYFGWIWAVVAPLFLLSVYTLVFTTALNIGGSVQNYALSIFIGIIVFNLFAELANRAPLLLPEHAHFIKKSIFPSEVLGWTSLFRALVYAGIGFGVFLLFEVILVGSLPLTLLLFPFVLVPFLLFMLGAVWFLAALGAFTRDVAFLMITIIPALLFVSPVFYTTAGLPLGVRVALHLNPLTPFIEMIRDVALIGAVPNPIVYFGSLAVAVLVFYGGYSFFMRYRSVIVDVL